MITLLWGLARDTPLAAVRRELDRFGVPVRFLDQRLVLRTELDLEVGERTCGRVAVADDEFDLADVGAVYLRPHDSTRVASVRGHPPSSPEHRHAMAVEAALLCWANRTPAYAVNRPAAAAGNGSKPFQLRAVAAAGFAIPETLVTNDPEAAGAFVRHHGEVIVKSVSGIRSRVRVLRPADLARLDDVATCPTQFQRRIPGTDVRVHVVGASVFATEIASDADDYRYPRAQGYPEPELAAIELPEVVARRCRRLAARLSLPVAGIDLRRTPDGDWYCFEVNPSPAFTYYESATGAPIAAAVAGLLAAASLCAHPGSRACPAAAAPAARRPWPGGEGEELSA